MYPQFTKGREFKYNNKSYTVPFSQRVGATPLIRLRLGDLFRSNYSKFAAARLFGAEINVITSENDESTEKQVYLLQSIDQEFRINGQAYTLRDLGVFATEALMIEKTRSGLKTLTNINSYFSVENTDIVNKIREKLNDLSGKLITVDENSLIKKSFETYASTVASANIDQGDPTTQLLNNDENPVIKSFKDSSGKGLAGVIESMNFTWLDFPWEIQIGKKKPMGCKIDISFSPIHDITPGIDHYGYNRAEMFPAQFVKKEV